MSPPTTPNAVYPPALAEIDSLQKQLGTAQEDKSAANDESVGQVAVPPSTAGAGRWIIAQKKSGRVSRLVLAYSMPGLERTVIQLVWDLADYPSAWPNTRAPIR